MRRTARGWLLIALGVWLLLIAASTAWHGEDLAAGAAAAPVLSDNGYQIDDSGRYVRLGELYWDEATGHLLLCSEWAADCPPGAPVTPEPEPSEAPGTVPSATPLPTYTPYPTLTPWPTYTLYPTYTPVGVLPSPTPDTGLPPQTPDHPERFCEAQVQGSFHVVRTDRSTSAQAVGSMAPSTWMRVEQIVRNAMGEWLYGTGENANGAALTGWALVTPNLVLQDSQACWAVPYEDEVDPLPTIAPTATPQIVTPIPTEPQPGDCVYSHGFAMTMRSGPGTNYSRIGTLPANVSVPVGHIWPDTASNQWAFVTFAGTTGWVAVKTGGAEYGKLLGDCSNVRRDEPRLSTVVGIRTVPGAVGHEDMYPVLAAKNIPFGVSPYASLNYCVSALEQGGTCVYRPGWPDCPDGVGVVDARQSAIDFMRHAEHAANQLKGYDNVWIEPINECSPGDMSGELLAWWGTWMSTYIDEAAARGWPPLALPGMAPGHGDAEMFRVWRPVLTKLRDKGGLFSMHAYTFHSKTGLCVYDEWEAARHTRNHKLMVEQGYSIPITITEAARWAGEAPVDVNDMVCWIEKARVEPYLHSVWLWLGGHHPTWPNANLDGHYTEIAERLNPDRAANWQGW